MIDRRALMFAATGVTLSACAAGPGGAQWAGESLLVDLERPPDEVIELWPGGAPGGGSVSLKEHYVERDNAFGLRDRAAHEITRPTLSLFRAARPSRRAMLIIPGGGYSWVVVEKEGFEGARYFSRAGYDVYVLKYRLPHQGWAAGPDTPLQDAQRALRLIRSRIAGCGETDARVMVMGFSAGGHLAGSLAQRFDSQVYKSIDAADGFSARPDSAVLIYPVVLMSDPFAHAGSRRNLIGEAAGAELRARHDLSNSPNPAGPPLLLLHALDDAAVPVENALLMALACRREGVEAVIHVFARGGHGFGLRGLEDMPAAIWPRLVMEWDAGQGQA